MPKIATIRKTVEPWLDRGLSVKEVRDLHALVMEAGAKQNAQLARVTMMYERFFTPAAVREWQKLTGIRVTGGEVEVPDSLGLGKQRLIDMRAKLQPTLEQLDERYEVTRRGESIAVRQRPRYLKFNSTQMLQVVQDRLDRGLSAGDVKEILDHVDGLKSEVHRLLARLSEVFWPYFTKGGARAWEAGTGIGIGSDGPGYPDDFLSPAELGRIRKAMRRDCRGIRSRFEVTRDGGRVVVRDTRPRPELDEVLRAGGPPEFSDVRLSARKVRKLRLTHKTFDVALERGGFGRVAASLVRELEELERANVSYLAPRDVAGATPRQRALAELIWETVGAKKRLSMARIRRVMPEMLVAYGKSYQSRQKNRLDDVYAALVEGAMGALARDYHAHVVEEGEPWSSYWYRMGYTAEKRRHIQSALDPFLPRLSLDEIEALYRKNEAGELGAQGFYRATRLTPRTFAEVRAMAPERFPIDPAVKKAAGRHGVYRRQDSGKEHDVEALERDFREEVIVGGGTVSAFYRARGFSDYEWQELSQGNAKLKLPSKYAPESIAAVAERATELFHQNPFVKVGELVGQLAADDPLVGRVGEITKWRYRQMYGIAEGEGFPSLRDDWPEVVAPVVREILDEHRESQPTRASIAELVQRIWDRFTENHLITLADRGLIDRFWTGVNRHGYDEAALRTAVAEVLEQTPGLSISAVQKRLAARGFDIEFYTAQRLVHQLRPQSVVAGRSLQFERNSFASRQLLQLIVRLLPPGTDPAVILKAWNAELERRGVPGVDLPENASASAKGASYWQDSSPSVIATEAVANILDEYAQAAPEGADHDEILAQVFEDYPTLTGIGFSYYRRRYEADPKAYPAIRRFVQGGELRMHGERKPGADSGAAKLAGGWSLAAAMAVSPPKELATLSESLRIPLRSELLDWVVDRLEGSRPLNGNRLLWVTHQLADVPAMAFAMRKAGLSPKNAVVVGSPYGSNDTVQTTLEEMGYDVRCPELDQKAYEQAVERALEEQVKGSFRRLVVLDDGGQVSAILHRKIEEDPEKWVPLAKRIKVVEQTSGGVNLAERSELQVPLVPVARSKSKEEEGKYIGKVVAERVAQAMERNGGSLEGKRVLVGGYGFVGKPLAEELAARGADVRVVENNPAKARHIEDFKVVSKARGVRWADAIIGATGSHDEPFMSLEDFEAMRPGAVFASASSKRVEGDLAGLNRNAKRRALAEDNPLVTLPSAVYTLEGKEITVLGDGWPVNFDGSVESVPPELIFLTDAALLGGIFQVCGHEGGPGLLPLDPDFDRDLLEKHKELLGDRTHEDFTVYDPADWQQDILDLAARLGLA